MRTIALISCGKSKRTEKAPAQHLYIGPLFTKSLAYARRVKVDRIYILSALYGLVELDQEIEPYEKTLNRMSSTEAARWAERVVQQLRTRTDMANDRFVILAGKAYYSRLVSHLSHVELPLKGLGLGYQLKFLSSAAL